MSIGKLALHKRFPISASCLLLVLTAIAILTSNYLEFHGRIMGPGHAARSLQLNKYDPIDVPPLLLRVSECTTLVQTRSYWHEDYTPGVPFYRPLSLTWFWVEYHVLGTNDYGRWTAVSIGLQLIFCVLFGLYIRRLTGSVLLASVSILIFAGYRAFFPVIFDELFVGGESAPAVVAAASWKDQVTQLCDIAVVGTLLLSLQKKWPWALLTAVISVLFKESGWITYALVLITLALNGDLRKLPAWVYAAAVVAVAIPMGMRLASGMGLIGGLQIGSNKFWTVRYFLAVCGPYVVACVKNQCQAPLLGTLLFFVCRWNQRYLILKVLGAGAAIIFCALIGSFLNGGTVVVNTAVLIDPSNQLQIVAICFLYTVGFVCLVTDKELVWMAVRMVPLVLVSTLPFAAASQVGTRALNLSSAFQSVMAAAAAIATYKQAVKYLSSYSSSVSLPRTIRLKELD